MFLDHLLAKTPQAGTHVANRVTFSADDLDTGRITAVAMPYGEVEFSVDETLDLGLVVKPPAIGFEQGLLDFLTYHRAVRPDWQRTPRTPKMHTHSSSPGNARIVVGSLVSYVP
jgi:hypothetical protein